MRNIAVNALLNLKEIPHILFVHGSIMTYHQDDTITITKALPQGINPLILILDLKITEGESPMKATTKCFSFELLGDNVVSYRQVSINCNNEYLHTIDIEKLGK